jgi:serine/threonine-protein kinase
MEDVSFLALLVHRGVLAQEEAEALVPEVERGGSLDLLLEQRLGWSPARIKRLRRTRAGEIPEIPGYKVQERLGSGGTADVFRVREPKTGRTFALKVLNERATQDEKIRKAFIQEARLLERLEHPGLVKGYGVARSGTTYFSRLACIDGQTLLEHLDDGRVFTEDEALRIALEVAEALAYLEREGIVHRDVKPGNIMLDRKGRAILIDLGFAAGGSDACAQGSAVGTVQYLSPEQARGGAAADCRSDIYSLGLSLFHIVVGRLPFESSDDREVLRMQVMQSLRAPELRGRRVSPLLQYFIAKMVAKDVEHRYQSWAELIQDVRANLAGRETLDSEKDARDASSARLRRRI